MIMQLISAMSRPCVWLRGLAVPTVLILTMALSVPALADTISQRFSPPTGFVRAPAPADSFATWLRRAPLKPAASLVKYFNGKVKPNNVYVAVLDFDVGKRDLQQCADAVIRLRAEYLYSRKQFDRISFDLTNGFAVPWARWQRGERVSVQGNQTAWHKGAEPSNNYAEFRRYLDFVFTYAGTLSLARSLHPTPLRDLAPGDVFVVGGSPGHAVIVADVAQNPAGKKVFLLVQSYMPAQDMQVLRNPDNPALSPWYSAEFSGQLRTPEWTFTDAQLKRW